MAQKEWVRLPTSWIERGELSAFRWGASGATDVAALLALIVIAQHADQETGIAQVTYDRMCEAANLSRAKLAQGLQRLVERGRIIRRPDLGQSAYELAEFDPQKGWGKLPGRGLYRGRVMPSFSDFSLRSPIELIALKIYLLFVSRRNNDRNIVHISYTKIVEYTRIERSKIKSSLSLLISNGLIYLDGGSFSSDEAGGNVYRIVHVDSYQHAGTRGGRELTL